MAQTQPNIPGEIIVDDKNRSELQAIIQFSSTIKSPTISIADPRVTFTITARQIWSADPNRPLTICTSHTPLDVNIPERGMTGSSLGGHIAYPANNESYRQLVFNSPAHRHNYRTPAEEDWQEVFGFVTLPSLDSKGAYTIDREIDLSSLTEDCKPNLTTGETVQFKLVDWDYNNSPGIRWWNWGDVGGDLKGKRLGYETDPVLNGKDREDQVNQLPEDLVLGYDNWKDTEDDEGNEMVRLEVHWDKTLCSVQVVG